MFGLSRNTGHFSLLVIMRNVFFVVEAIKKVIILIESKPIKLHTPING